MNRKRIYFIFASTILVLFFCGWLNHSSDKKISGFILESHIPFVEAKTGAINILKDSCLIYYMDDFVMFRTPYTFTQYGKTEQRGDTTITLEDPSDLVEVRFKNFIYKKNFSTGLRYDSISVKKNIVFNIDSFLRKKAFKEAKFYDSSNDVLVESKKDKKNGLIYEKYIPKIKFDDSYNDTTFLVFAPNFKPIHLSLSKEADSLKKMKLVEVKLSYNAKPRTVNNLKAVPKRDFVFKIRELKITNSKEILSLFERFKKDSEKLNLK